jgi:23S rRNA (uracil1939-C5)-methyltransferase
MEHLIEITGAAHGGDGVGRIDGRVCFVPYAFPGDRLRIQIQREAKGVLWGEILEIVEPSPHRSGGAGCVPHQESCGACAWRAFSYPGQAEWKRRIVAESLKRIGGIEVKVDWIEDRGLRLGYRTKAELHGDGEQWGFYRRGTHELHPVRECPLCHPRLNAAIERLWQVKASASVELTVNPEGEDVLAWSKWPVPKLQDVFPQTNTIEDRFERASFRFDGVPVVNGAFSQSSLLLNRLLLRATHALVGPAKSVLDLYCGSGNLSLGLAKQARVLGLDHSGAAVHAAASVGIGEYRAANEGAFQETLRKEAFDVVLLDPPRQGAKNIADALGEAKAQAIVYVSCDPATLARDLKTLALRGWQVTRLVAVDMFPHTPHVETVCRLER